MSFSFFRGQLAEVMQWHDPPPSVLLWKFPLAHGEIKDASKLLVGPSQGVLPVHKAAGLAELVEACGARLLYLPPNSPDFTPLELASRKL